MLYGNVQQIDNIYQPPFLLLSYFSLSLLDVSLPTFQGTPGKQGTDEKVVQMSVNIV